MVMIHFGVGIFLGAPTVAVAPSNPGLCFHFRWILKHGRSRLSFALLVSC